MTAVASTVQKGIISVRQLLAAPNLAIPQYQRPYKWTSRHVGQLFSDITAFRNKTSYRLGTVVFHLDDRQKNIVDGQQRTITLMLAVHALIRLRRDRLERNDLKEQLDELKRKMVIPRFESDISKVNIHANYLEIARIIDRADFDEEQINFLLNRCEVVTFTLTDISEAFQFFDSQNARGKDLEPHDLLKAFHLREFSAQEDHLKRGTVAKWENSETAELSTLFAQYLYRIRNWAKGESARYFGKEDTDLFKGVNIETISNYPYIEHFRLAHHFVDHYNGGYERKIDGHKMAFPFYLDQIIINGRRFFEMTDHYLGEVGWAVDFDTLKKRIGRASLNGFAKKVFEAITSYEGRNRTGDRYVRVMFDCLLIYYIDKFGFAEISRAIEKIFIWAYSLRLQMQVLQLASMDNYVLESNLFKRLKDATHPSDFLRCSLPVVTQNRSSKTKAIEKLFKEMRYYEQSH
ncbi:hypothetical protein DBW_2036 [Desulfuromonas sp. DDH964]|uniref:DUF262 domain-containing protein n=1 Tax=Desulfuromonas sp. DDH964 TaxID=1823759 RepID=UPI00078ECCBD|nr:DUF262 domain-containing protein [Desulfuromonas sp. DDH964]AMV72380.1 hypothetical protein DBW_2036 [Desulfuromonas sp. DDH964]